jgi:hypothetical protein
MSLILDGTNGLTFNNATTQNSGGKVIQVVNSLYTTYSTTTNASLVDTGLQATITPLFSTSKILVNVFANGCDVVASQICNLTLTDGSNNILQCILNRQLNTSQVSESFSISYLHSPATTSAFTYKLRFSVQGGTTWRFNDYDGVTTVGSSMVLMEIAQ